MKGVLAVAVLSVGLAFAAYSFDPGAFEGADASVSFASSAAIAATLADLPDTGRLVEFSPGAGLKPALTTASSSWFLAPSPEEVRLAAFSAQFADAQARQPPPPPPASTSFVELEPWRAAVLVQPTGLGPNGTEVSSRYLSPDQRLQLVTALQAELTRVGCYAGEASGSWNSETRAAIATFMDRVNAVLPIHEPDYTLLELVKAHPRSTCEASCPEGQNFDAHGRCIPLAVLAQARKPHLNVAKAAQPRPAALTAVQSSLPSKTLPPVTGTPTQIASVAKPSPFPAPMGLGSGQTAPGTTASPYRMAEAEVAGELGLTDDTVRPLVTESAPSSAPKRKSRPSSSEPRRVSSYRHVQHLFEHPLGRL